MLLDIKSLLITSGLEVMVNALVLMLAWRSEKELRTVIGFWGISQALLGLGMFLVALQGSVPVFWGLVFSNTCMALGFVAEQEGLACYIGKRGYLRPVMLGTLFCFAMGMCFFSYVYASAAYRVVTFSLGTVIFTMVFVITLVKSEANREAPVRLLVATYIYQTIIMAVRTVVAFLQGDYAYSFLNFGGIHVILLLALFTCNTSQAVCYFWLIVHRLSRENQKQAAEITRTLSMKQETLEWLVDERTRDLQASESKVRALIDAVPDMLLVSSGEGRIEEAYVNHNFSTLFSPETLQGKLIQEVLPQGIADEIVQRTQQAMASNQNAQYEFALLHGTDKLQLRTRIMRLNDRQVFHIVTDITEQKRLETEMLGALSQLQEAQKLSTAGVMAASIVHDLGQPLNSIKVSTEGLLYISGMGTKLNMDKIMGELQRISRQVERIEGVITNVRHIVRQDLQLRRGIVLDAALFHAIEAFQSVPGNAAVAIQYQCQVPQAIVCAADSEIEQILFNLLKNAQEAVTVSPKPDKFIFVTAAENGEWLEIAVSDNGSGIKEAILPNVFDPFFTTKKKYGSDNLGFGLAIVKSLTESLKGSVTAHNNEIGGATFVIRLLNENQRRISDEHNSH